jgi:hypothetical protein
LLSRPHRVQRLDTHTHHGPYAQQKAQSGERPTLSLVVVSHLCSLCRASSWLTRPHLVLPSHRVGHTPGARRLFRSR